MRRVLVVEDDQDTNDSIVDVLNAEECSCLAALDGEHALALLIAQKADLVLLDLDLPGITGPEFLVRKAAIPEIAGIPVVVITGLANPPKLDNTVATLCKPFTIEELVDVVRNYGTAPAPAV